MLTYPAVPRPVMEEVSELERVAVLIYPADPRPVIDEVSKAPVTSPIELVYCPSAKM